MPSYAAGSNPKAVTVGDFNGDGIPDLALANLGAAIGDPGTVSILLGNGDGTFQAAGNYAAGLTSFGVAVGDFNGDGMFDVAVANYGDAYLNHASVSILLGKGDGTFQAGPDCPAGQAACSLAVADFNGDGIPDLAVAHSTTEGTVSILLGNGDGSFQEAASYTTGSLSNDVTVGDFNGDGIPDLAVANAGDHTVSILLGNGDGTFRAAVNVKAGTLVATVVVGDFNGDGIADLAAVNVLSSNVSVLLGNGDGTFQVAVNYAVGPGIKSSPTLAVADCNSDGIADLVVVFGGGVRVLLGQGDGTFQTTALSYVAGSYPLSAAVADFNGDGWPDLAVAYWGSEGSGGGVAVLLNDGTWAP